MIPASEAAQNLLVMLARDQELAFDVETNGLKWQKTEICGYSLSDGKDAFYVPVRHAGNGNISGVPEYERQLAQIIKDRTKKLIGHNIKFDKHQAQNHGIDLGNKIKDTMVYAALLDENRKSYSLENVSKGYDIVQKLNIKTHIQEKFGVPYKDAMGHYWRLSGDDPIAVEYAATDTLGTFQLYEKQSRDLYAQQLDMIVGIEDELTYVLQKMERRGIKIDLNEAEKLRTEAELMQIEAHSAIPLDDNMLPVNVKSGPDIRKYFEFLGINDWPVTEKGNPSFTKIYLKGFEEGEAIMNARKIDHFIDSFLTPLEDYTHNGRIYTNYNQTTGEFGGTRTGRLSSYGPNMQQVPKRDEILGPKFRKIFIPDTEFKLIEFDYSQMEPRLFTHYSDEPILLEGYNKTPFIDMHDIAAEYMGISRNVAKSLNLGMMYAMGALKLALALGITEDAAREIRNKWYRTFIRVRSFTKAAAKRAEERGFVKTILGRRCRITDPKFSYKAANRIVQGGSADILKWKLVQVNRYIEREGLDDIVQMLLTIHDSIVFQIHESKLDQVPILKDIIERVQVPPFNLKVPFVAEHKGLGDNWAVATYG